MTPLVLFTIRDVLCLSACVHYYPCNYFNQRLFSDHYLIPAFSPVTVTSTHSPLKDSSYRSMIASRQRSLICSPRPPCTDERNGSSKVRSVTISRYMRWLNAVPAAISMDVSLLCTWQQPVSFSIRSI